MPAFVQTEWMGNVHSAIDFAEEPNPLRSVLGKEHRIPITETQADMPIDVLIATLKFRGLLK